MSQTKKRSQCELPEADLHLPGWNTKQRHALFEGIKAHGLRKLKKLQRFVGSKTQEEVRIASELYKKELRNRELFNDTERQTEPGPGPGPGISYVDYKAWLYLYLASKNRAAGNPIPMAALAAFLENSAQLLRPSSKRQLSFPNWRSSEIQDFLAAVELAKLIEDIPSHIPSKSQLEIMAATDAYTIICDTRNHALKNGRIFPTYDELKPGYIYLQCIAAALHDNEKLKNLKIAPNADIEMARAEFVLKEWLMPDVGTLPKGWTRDEKYTLIVAIEHYGQNNILKIQSHFPKKTRGEVKEVINAYLKEVECKEKLPGKTTCEIYESMTSWGSTLTLCKENKHKILAAKRLISALEELPEPKTKDNFLNLFVRNLSNKEMTAIFLNVWMHKNKRKSKILIPLLQVYVRNAQFELCKEIRQNMQKP